MKSINKMAVAALLALSSAGVASAQTYHVTGSTAYRVADVSAEVQLVGASGKATYYGSSLTGANYSVVENSTGTVKFENYFNGSIAGDEALVDTQTTLNFPSGAVNTPTGPLTVAVASTNTVASGGTSAPSTTPTGVPQNNTISFTNENDNAKPDIAFSDVAFATAQQIILASTDHTTNVPNATNDSFVVGVVPFVFICNGTPDVTDLGTAGGGNVPVLSMDPQKFTYTWESGGSTLLSFFTGLNSDESIFVYPMGRDVDSGTRATALAETGYGLTGSGIITGNVAQFYPYADTTDLNNNSSTNTSTSGVIGVDSTLTNPTDFGVAPVPAESIDGYTMGYGDGGYYSGGNLAIGISTAFDSSVTQTVLMTYLGVSDAANALSGAKSGTNSKKAYLMSYCGNAFYPTTAFPAGVTAASNASAIYEGKYTFWGFEHEYCSAATGISTEASALASALNGGLDQLSSNGVTLNNHSLKVVRAAGDGSNIQ